MRRTSGLLAALLVLTVTAAGCGSDDPQTTSTGGPGPAPLAISISVGGGYAPFGADFANVPLVLLADGTAFTGGAVPAIYPGPAVSPVLTGTLSGADLSRLLQEARTAGLDADHLDTGQPSVTDMGTTTISVVLDGVTHEHQVYALGFEEAEAGDAVTGLTEQQRQTRHAISSFVGDVRAAAERVATTRYEPTGYQVLVTNGDPSIDIDSLDGHPIKPNELQWPFPDVPLAEHACIDVDAAQAPTLTDALAHATQITIWRDAAQRPWSLATRVALPGDEPCSPPG